MNLQTIDNFTRKLGLVSTLIDMVMEATLPKATASADCGNCGVRRGDLCHTYCDGCHPTGTLFAVYKTIPLLGGPGPCTDCGDWGCTWEENAGQCPPGHPC